MAIFERKIERKIKLDDTQCISCYIETAQTVDNHTEYVIRVQRGPFKENSWRILRRYNEFAKLNKVFQISGIQLPLPGKRFIGNMHPDFIAERRKALQEFLNEILMNPILASSLPTKRFVDPDTYSQSFHENAVQGASLCLRSDGIYTLGQSYGQMGWRLRKHYFKVSSKPPQEKSLGKHLVKSSSQSNQSKNQHSSNTQHSNNNASSPSSNGTHIGGSHHVYNSGNSSNQQPELVLTWTEYGPDKYVDEKEIHSILKSLISLQHPYIEPILYSTCNDSGALVIRKLHCQGTLKDLICLSTPKKAYLSKYGSCKNRSTLSLKDIALYGFQILDALKFLHSKGMAFGHLHTGNIVISEDGVHLLDIENFVLGVPAFYRPFFVQHSKMHTMENVDVYCFGHVLFEMCMGYPMQESVMRTPLDIPEPLKHLLDSLLSKEACKTMLPTLDQLIEHKFFKDYASENLVINKGYLKLSNNAKEQLKNAVQKTELRLQNEQKSVKNQKRLVRVQELMSSEEEKKKTKHKMKIEHKQSKLKQQTSLNTQNGPSLSLASTSSSFTQSTTNEPEVTTPKSSTLKKSDSIFSQNISQETPLSPPSTLGISSQIYPPPPPALPVDIPTAAKSAESIVENVKERSALLESICRFNRGSLRKVKSNDD